MACSCHKKNGMKKVVEHNADPYSQCLICAEKHFSAAFTEAKEFGYMDKNRSAITGDLECATRHAMKSYNDLAEVFRQMRHEVQMRNENFVFEKWEKIAKLLQEKIRSEMLVSNSGKIYIFSNVEYPEEKKLKVVPDDLLVFLNKAVNISYYKDHQNKVIYHRSPKESYGKVNETVPNYYVFDNGNVDQIPGVFIDSLKKEYDWDYPIEEGKVRCATTGYMVVKYLQSKFPNNEIVLVNFGYDVKKSTYRCPWHNWKFEAKALAKFEHIYTEETVTSKMPDEKLKVFLDLSGWLGDNIYASAVVKNLVSSGKVKINIGTNRPKLWENCPYIDKTITPENADRIIRQHNNFPWKIDTPHIIQAVTQTVAQELNIGDIPVVALTPEIYMDIPPERLIEEKYILINTGWQNSAPTKKWHDEYWKRLIELLPEMKFVQMGQSKNHAVPVPGAESMIDKTDLTKLIQLVRDASCIISPPSGVIHIAGALNVPFISIAGGREPSNLVSYPCGTVLSNVGNMDCCKGGGCHRNNFMACKNVSKLNDKDCAGKCMADITPETVLEALTKYI